MNREPFGEKCECSHFESEHVPIKHVNSIPGPHDLGVFLPHPPDMHQKRGNCKLCDCINFKVKKKGWVFGNDK